MAGDQKDAENQHFLEVCYSFLDYNQRAMNKVAGIQNKLALMSPADLALWSWQAQPFVGRMQTNIEANQRFLDSIVACFPGRPGVECMPSAIPTAHIVGENNASKVQSTLRQFVRDWSHEGAAERRACYAPLLEALQRYLPLPKFWHPDDPWTRVLCPGSGLGRLPFEVSMLGYEAQGNEFSYHMILGSHWALHTEMQSDARVIFPYVTGLASRRLKEDHMLAVRVPDVLPGALLTDDHSISFCAGEFVEVYGDQTAEWDALLTPFFVDTAKNILIYIRTIANILKPGGLWANLGPLLFHFADEEREPSIELSWEEIRPGICKYFDIKEERRCQARYTSHPDGLFRTAYTCIFFAAIRNSVPVQGNSSPVY